MKKTLIFALLMLAGCDDSSNSSANSNADCLPPAVPFDTTKTPPKNPCADMINKELGDTSIALSTSNQPRSVEFFMKPENDGERRKITSSCNRNNNQHPECVNAGHATAFILVYEKISGEPSVEKFLQSESYRATASWYCPNPTIKNPKNLTKIPFDHPICQNWLTAIRRMYKDCVAVNPDFSLFGGSTLECQSADSTLRAFGEIN
ncbi:MAG: hypothetical protein JNK86_06875 [Alphaproteobacteria bacterium]|nr:hypothetical protein [Alphaproteobacteria bacterium]